MNQSQYTSKWCQEYANLMKIIECGAYSEEPDGSYWYHGEDISERIDTLIERALAVGLHFVRQADGTYTLESASGEEIAAYQAAKEQA